MFNMIIYKKKFEFEGSRTKVKPTVGIFRKNIVIALVPLLMDQFYCNFTQVLSMAISWTSLSLSVL